MTNSSSEMRPGKPTGVKIAPPVSSALSCHQPVVALESALITHGMPFPDNLEMALTLQKEVEQQDATPATVAVVDGQIRVGLDPDEIEGLARATETHKASIRDLPVLALQGLTGGTTVAATAWAAAQAGIRVFCTGGIGGVHHGNSWDISADLPILATTPLIVVCAGAKSILDLGKTVEWLETHGVPTVGVGTDDFPAFFTRSSGLPVTVRLDAPEQIARLAIRQWEMGLQKAVLVCVPVPEEAALPAAAVQQAIEGALRDADALGISGKETTPYLLAAVNRLTEGESLKTNKALLQNNAQVAAQIARELAALRP